MAMVKVVYVTNYIDYLDRDCSMLFIFQFSLTEICIISNYIVHRVRSQNMTEVTFRLIIVIFDHCNPYWM